MTIKLRCGLFVKYMAELSLRLSSSFSSLGNQRMNSSVKNYTHGYSKIFHLILTTTTQYEAYIERNNIVMGKRYLGKAEPRHQVKVICLWLDHNKIPKVAKYVYT